MRSTTPNFLSILLSFILMVSCKEKPQEFSKLEVAENPHYFQTADGKPFFWLGDTGWLMFNKLNRKEIDTYFEDRKAKGFNVIQVMVLHSLDAVNVYGDSALVAGNVTTPVTTEGNDAEDQTAYDFWDHIDYAVKTAQQKDLFLAMVPVWGGNVNSGGVTKEQAVKYATFLGERYKNAPNVIWLNGGDTFGNEYTEVWEAIGSTLKQINPDKMQTFHPRGRMQSSDWFQKATWLDFNMFQSGHRRYDQDDSEKAYGEDNWRYVNVDYHLKPVRPTVDGEPSYEGIPQGLHDTLQPFWTAREVRRYGYWSVFAGAAGFTYGHSAVMQMYRAEDKAGAYGNKVYWTDALNAPGAGQMQYLKDLMLDFPYFERVPDQSLVAGQGERYNYIAATRGPGYALMYTYTGREIALNKNSPGTGNFTARWYDPRNGTYQEVKGNYEERLTFDPPGEEKAGNDWVLVISGLKE